MQYETPLVVDFGTLRDITEATSLFGAEDMSNKLVPIHHVPIPSGPAGP